MIASLPPGLLLIAGALAVPFLRGWLRWAWMLALPVVGFVDLIGLEHGAHVSVALFDYELQPVRVDRLSLAFGYIFYIAAFLGILYAVTINRTAEQVAALIYMGSAVGALFAGDLITLFVYWEVTAVASAFVVWAGNTERSYRAGMRYLAVQVVSGVLLLSGALVQIAETGSVAFAQSGLQSLAGLLIFLAFGIKCAFPFLHNWLQDAYPEASPTGTVFLSAFTTKLAVYGLARGFAGEDILIWIGALMTAFPIFYAVIENDLRRVLAYSLNNQLGFMVVGIGIGTELSLNGTVAHAFTHILYKSLLFMSMGAVLYRVGTVKGSELGGLYKSMPWTAAFCIVGAASISAFPLFSGFVSKSLIMSATAGEGLLFIWFVLLFASAGVFHHSGIKIPYFAFFAHDSGKRCKEAPLPMLLAMGATAFLCIGIGVWPDPLYALLPHPVDYVPYTTAHVVTQLQLLLFSALAFAVLMRTGLYPPELRSVNLDIDWVYRRGLPAAVRSLARAPAGLRDALAAAGVRTAFGFLNRLVRLAGPESALARTWQTAGMVGLIVIVMAVYLVLALV
ncbi:MAG: Na(+)/H(+) antiporter subunit D [Rhodospirillaceae bacterium]|nr:Na(+)/H(+) antiporter subunit D [Rhodospirillaceae bacterium]